MKTIWKLYKFQLFDGYHSFIYVWTEDGIVRHQRAIHDIGFLPIAFDDIRGQELKVWNKDKDFKIVKTKMTQEELSKGYLIR